MRDRTVRRAALAGVAMAATLAVAACGSGSAASSSGGDTVTLVTHESFAVSEDVLKQFEKQTGLRVEHVSPGDAGMLVNQLVLTKDAPLGDAVFGIDNTFGTRALTADVLEPYRPAGLSSEAAKYATDDRLTPIDMGDVCVNVDHTWFDAHQVAEPKTLDDLAKPAYKDMLVVENPATSSPGLAFLLATIDEYGQDGWRDYWAGLTANGVKVAEGWSDAYNNDFSGAEGDGPRPIVVSYSTSPAFTLTDDGARSTTGSLLDTCYRQVEYAGVLKGAKNPQGARRLIDFMTQPQFQADIPEKMYMYPADSSIMLPEAWTRFAPLAARPHSLDPKDVAKNRDEWIKQWTATVVG